MSLRRSWRRWNGNLTIKFEEGKVGGFNLDLYDSRIWRKLFDIPFFIECWAFRIELNDLAVYSYSIMYGLDTGLK